LMGLGSLESDLQNDKEALEYYSKANAVKVGSLDAINGIVMSFNRLSDFEQALSYERDILWPGLENYVLSHNKVIGNLLTNLGLAHFNLKTYEVAAAYFCLAVRVSPFNEAFQENAKIGMQAANKGSSSRSCGSAVDFGKSVLAIRKIRGL